jgi:hypothetical protein
MSNTFADEKFVEEIYKLMVLVPYIFLDALFLEGYVVTKLAEALRCKSEGRGFDFRCGHFDFSLP